MIGDPLVGMQDAVRKHLKALAKGAPAELDGIINSKTPWRPHIYQPSRQTAWQLHSVLPDSNTWEKRIARSLELNPKLKIGVVAQDDIFHDPDFLLVCHRLRATLLTVREKKDSYTVDHTYSSVPDFVCESRIRLNAETARSMLDVSLQHALAAKTKTEKGITLELLVALLLSQVDNFEVSDIGISNRTQQMDVLVHNRSVGGMLGGSPLVLAEAKNWRTQKVTPTEYAEFLRKLATRNRRAKLGFMVTTGSFTAGLALEARRDSKEDIIVVFVDGKALPEIWRSPGRSLRMSSAW